MTDIEMTIRALTSVLIPLLLSQDLQNICTDTDPNTGKNRSSTIVLRATVLEIHMQVLGYLFWQTCCHEGINTFAD